PRLRGLHRLAEEGLPREPPGPPAFAVPLRALAVDVLEPRGVELAGRLPQAVAGGRLLRYLSLCEDSAGRRAAGVPHGGHGRGGRRLRDRATFPQPLSHQAAGWPRAWPGPPFGGGGGAASRLGVS